MVLPRSLRAAATVSLLLLDKTPPTPNRFPPDAHFFRNPQRPASGDKSSRHVPPPPATRTRDLLLLRRGQQRRSQGANASTRGLNSTPAWEGQDDSAPLNRRGVRDRGPAGFRTRPLAGLHEQLTSLEPSSGTLSAPPCSSITSPEYRGFPYFATEYRRIRKWRPSNACDRRFQRWA